MSEQPEHKEGPDVSAEPSPASSPGQESAQTAVSLPKMPREHVLDMRRLVHEMGNALEIIVQTNYLLNMGEAEESTKQWLKMMDVGVRQATEVSKEMRQYLMLHTATD